MRESSRWRTRTHPRSRSWRAEQEEDREGGLGCSAAGRSALRTGYEMTVIRLSIRAFRNVHFYSSSCQRPRSLTYSSAQCIRWWTHCSQLSNCADYRQPITALLHTNSNGFLNTSLMKPFLYAVRHKGKKSQKQNKTHASQEEEDDEEEVDPEDISDYEDEHVEDPSIPKDYKDVEKAVQSFRFDVILTAGLDTSRNKVEEAFYDGKLRLNGEKLWKKSRAVKVGDILDLIVEENRDAGTVTVMRTILKNVLKEKTSTDKFKVLLRRWKKLTIPKVSEASKTTGMNRTDADK
ncbi:mitochondrial transcription rescue factor 1 isoform X2 [Phyllobates terribilis]|uniref:mitochondrial transcription rescue factor 1 isoform X2 n=1 Tax=Phyllobates terribilis TaxID=111132 RepID=UPI003CCB0573